MSFTNHRSYFYKERLGLKIGGVSFSENEHIVYKVYSFLLLSLINYSYPFITLSDLFKHDFDTLTDVIDYQFASCMTMAKTTVLLLNRIKIGKLLEKLQQPPFLPNLGRGDDEEELIRKCLRITSIQTISYWITAYGSIIIAVSYTLAVRLSSSDYHDWQFTYGQITIINTTYSPNFEILWFYQNLSLVSITMHFSTTDLLIAAVLAHISFQFKMLQNYIRRSVENSYRMMLKDCKQLNRRTSIKTIDLSIIPWKYLRNTLKDVVDYHLEILSITNEVENVFSGLLLFLYLSTICKFCFSVYHASLLSPTDLRFLRMLIEVFSLCFPIGLICYWGEQVLFESQNIMRTAFETNFVGTSLKYQKALIFIMRRSLNPSKLTAGKFALVKLATFTWVLRTCYSTFMVFYKTNNK